MLISGLNCEDLLEGGAAVRLELDPTFNLITYLEHLFREGHLVPAELQRIRNALAQKRGVINPFAVPERGALSSAQLIARDGIAALLSESAARKGSASGLDEDRLARWLDEALARESRTQVRRDETRQETRHPFRVAMFHSISPGEFWMGPERPEEGRQFHVRLTHAVEWMDTDVTQGMWAELMGENPAHFQNGEESVTVVIQGHRIKLQPDHPVENITWWSALEYANRKSKQAGLTSAYDLSRIRWEPGTSAKAGTLVPASEEEAMKLEFIYRDGGSGEDIYRAEGFRLGTEAEWEYLLRNRGRSQGAYPHDLSEKDLPDVAWYAANSGRKTHPSGSTAGSGVVDGKPFHDLIGNVWKWTHDRYSDTSSGGIDPRGAATGSLRVIRGGGRDSSARNLRSAERYSRSDSHRSSHVGFRLVRTLK